MSNKYDIQMDINDTLELDTIIKKSDIASDPIDNIKHNGGKSTSHILEAIETHTGIFKPTDSGEYTITINGQDISINVTNPTGNVVLDYEASDFDSSTTTWSSTKNTKPLDFKVSNPSKTSFLNGDDAVDSNSGLGTFYPPEELNASSLQKMTIEMDIKSDVGGDPSPWAFADSDGKSIRMNFNEGNNFYVEMSDSNGNTLKAQPKNTLELSDGTRRKVTVSFDGPSNKINVIVDGNDINLNYLKTQSPSISSDLSNAKFGVMGLALSYDGGGNSRRSASGLYGHFRLHDEFIQRQTI